MCICRSRFRLSSFDLCQHLVKAIDTSIPKHFKLTSRRTRNIKRIKTLETIKFLYKLQLEFGNDRRYIDHGGRSININTIQRPRLIRNIQIYKNKNNILGDTNEIPGKYGRFTKSMFGLKIHPGEIFKSKLSKRITGLYPIELRDIVFSFSMKYMDGMGEAELQDFYTLLEHDSKFSNLTLLDCISAKANPPSDLLENNRVLKRLLAFVSSNHPLLQKD